MKHYDYSSANREYIYPQKVQTIDILNASHNLDYRNLFTKHKFIKLWKIYSSDVRFVLFLNEYFDHFPLLQELEINYPLHSTINRYGVIKEGICDEIYHKLKWNKNKMDCCFLFYVKMKKYLTKDIARMICNFVLYKNPRPEDWKYKPICEVLVTPDEIIDIDSIDFGIVYAKRTLSILTGNKGVFVYDKKFLKTVKEEIEILGKKRRKLTKAIYFK